MAQFNNDLVEPMLEECNEYHFQLETCLRKIQEEGLDVETTLNQDHFDVFVYHLYLMCNKHCLMSYMYNRAQITQSSNANYINISWMLKSAQNWWFETYTAFVLCWFQYPVLQNIFLFLSWCCHQHFHIPFPTKYAFSNL